MVYRYICTRHLQTLESTLIVPLNKQAIREMTLKKERVLVEFFILPSIPHSEVLGTLSSMTLQDDTFFKYLAFY